MVQFNFLSYCAFTICAFSSSYAYPSRTEKQSVYTNEGREFWFTLGQRSLEAKLTEKKIEKEAKNVIFFLGDGMSVATVTAARIFKGQRVLNSPFGEEAELHFETFPHTGVSKTFCTDDQTADSACSATAYLCGVKANTGTLGVTQTVTRKNCTEQNKRENQVDSIMAWAQSVGKSTGVVTTTRITHATPAGAFAHSAYRDWESDWFVKKDGVDPSTCDDIAAQLILQEPGRNFNVILGGGRTNFFGSATHDPEVGFGNRTDGRNLIQMWKQSKLNAPHEYVDSVQDLLKVNTSNVSYLLGLFAPSHFEYVEKQEKNNDPSLAEMTRVAIEILQKNPNGFVLLVEGGRIDHAHHENYAQRALLETLEFEKAIKEATSLTSVQDTLTIVTADHSHTMTITGYPARGTDVLSIAGESDIDFLPYPILSYASGPGYRNSTVIQTPSGSTTLRFNITNENLTALNYRSIATLPLKSENHGADDVLIYSQGPFAHLLTGVQLQSYIPWVIGYSACMGPGQHFCNKKGKRKLDDASSNRKHVKSNSDRFGSNTHYLVTSCFLLYLIFQITQTTYNL